MSLLDYPLVLSLLCFIVLWLSAQAGTLVRKRRSEPLEKEREDLGVVLGAALTLLALVIGFSFSMATGRYDQRKVYEEAEANAIGTEFTRAGLLPDGEAIKVRKLLKDYLRQRIAFYVTRNSRQLESINAATTRLQNDLWAVVEQSCSAQPSAVSALVLSGMNDVLNSQGYAQAAWWNRIPWGAWALMIGVGIFCVGLFGYNANREDRKSILIALPLVVSAALFVLADMDSPRRGLIRVHAKNLESLSTSLPSNDVPDL